MHKIKKELLERSLVKSDDLLHAICYEVNRSLLDKTGIDCVLFAKRKVTSATVCEELTEADKDQLARLLEKLPPLHGRMAHDESQQFWAAYMQLDDRPDWLPVLAMGGLFNHPYLEHMPERKAFLECEGESCFTSKVTYQEPSYYDFSLSKSARKDFSKLLTKLPPLHGRMTAEEIDCFLMKYRKLPDRLDWEPRIISEEDRSQRMAELKVKHAQSLNEAVKNGEIIPLTEDHIRCKSLSYDWYISHDQVVWYLRKHGLLGALEIEDTSVFETTNESQPSMQAVKSTIRPESASSQKPDFASAPLYEQMAMVIDDSIRGDQMRDLIARALREVRDDSHAQIFDWLVKEAAQVKNAEGKGPYSILTGKTRLAKKDRVIEWRNVGNLEELDPTMLRKRLSLLKKGVAERLNNAISESS